MTEETALANLAAAGLTMGLTMIAFGVVLDFIIDNHWYSVVGTACGFVFLMGTAVLVFMAVA